jgi:cell division protein FtsQ
MWDDARQLNAIAVTLGAIALAFLAWAGTFWMAQLPLFAFREVVVTTPLERTSAAHLESVIRSELAGTFFSMNLDAARVSLARVPWVKSVALRRQWPQRLEVEIDEHSPLARWNDSGLVDTDGEVFVANDAGDLPQFDGPEGQSQAMAGRYREWGALLAPLSLRLSGLTLSARGGWRLRAEGGGGAIALDIGRDGVEARLARFVAAYGRTLAVLARDGRHVDRVDLRYRNGFAAHVPGFREKPSRRVS